MVDTRRQGSRWERAAERFLRLRGLRPLERNFRARFGEIDLVMRDDAALVFVEVRYRHRERYGSGAETVTWHKQRRLTMAASLYLRNRPRLAALPCRFDVVSITGPEKAPRFDWIQQAFEAA